VSDYILIIPQFQRAIDEVEEKYETWVLGSIKRTYGATNNAEEVAVPVSAKR